MKANPMSVNTNTRMRWEVIKKLPELRNLHKKKVLDVGSGLGFFSHQFAEQGACVTAVDVDKASLDYISEKYGIKTQYINIETGKLPDEKFDIILIGEVIEHVKNPSGLIEKAFKSLSDSGIIIVTSPALEGYLIHSKGKSLCHDEGSEKHERDGFLYKELKIIFDNLNLKIIHHSYCIFLFAELFMQLTKLGYTLKKKTYEGQSDVLEKTNSLSFKLLYILFPIIILFLKTEQSLCSWIGLKGHCHVFLIRRQD